MLALSIFYLDLIIVRQSGRQEQRNNKHCESAKTRREIQIDFGKSNHRYKAKLIVNKFLYIRDEQLEA